MIRGNCQNIKKTAVLFGVLLLIASGLLWKSSIRVNEVSGYSLPKVQPYSCPRTCNLTTRGINYVMCAKPVEIDNTISFSIINYGIYEKLEVEIILDLLALYPSSILLDIGANIGTFTVAAAAAHFKVVAVDPFPINLGYIRTSLELSGTSRYVRYILNTVSDVKETLYGVKNRINEGGTNFVPKEDAEKKPAEDITEGVDSVLFEDILDTIAEETIVLKIDVEGYECKALGSYLHSEKKKKFIPYIVLEWIHISRNLGNSCPDLQWIIQGFTKSGYSPYSMDANRVELKIEDEKQWNNALWVHKDARRGF